MSGTPAPGLLPADPGEITRRARLLMAVFARMGLSALTPGERDLAMGPALLRRLLADAKVPVVSANLFDDRGRRLFDADRMIETAGIKIGVFGVIRAAPEDAALWKTWRLEARDPIAAARDEVAALRGRGADLIVALLHVGGNDETRKLLLAAPGIDWAVLGHSAMNLETPEAIGGAHTLEAMSMGKDFGRLDLHIVGGAHRPFVDRPFVDRGQRAQLQAILADHRRQIADLRQRGGESPQPATRKYFSDRVAELEKAIARDTALLRAQPAAIRGSWFENRIVPLDTATADHPAIAALVAQYNHENQRRAAAGLPVGVAMRSAAAPAPAAPSAHQAAPAPEENVRYAGTFACGGCHARALAFWRTTPHARALETLIKKKRERDPTCVGCHVTGFLRPGGTGDITLATARLRDVGCEACHGPGLDHIGQNSGGGDAGRANGASSKPPGGLDRKVEASVCRGCHTPDQTNGDFDEATFRQAILGAGHGGV